MQTAASKMPCEVVMTTVQTELTNTVQPEDITPKLQSATHDEIVQSQDDDLTHADNNPKAYKNKNQTSSQIPVITSTEAKKKPYGGRPLRFQCPNCERRFHAPSHLKRHMLCHTSERPFQCHICNKGFLQAWHLGRHMTTHTGNKPFNCPECPKTFGSRFEMKTHCNYIHRGIKEHECHICKKLFTLRSNLKVHMRKHTGEKPYECHVCSKKFGQRGHLQYHLRKHEGAEVKISINNNNKVKDEESLREEQHIDVENDDDIQFGNYDSGVESVTSEYQPSPKVSRQKSLSIEHIHEMTKQKQQQSRELSSRVINESSKSLSEVPLSGRMFDHTNPKELKPFVCVSCNCGFGEISSLRAHVRHSHLRKGIESGHFSCAHCNHSFNEIDALKSHYEEKHKSVTITASRPIYTPLSSPPLSPNYNERRMGEKYSHEFYGKDYEPSMKRSMSQSVDDERLVKSPGGLSTSSDITYDRRPYIRKGFYMQCPPNCECESECNSPVSNGEGDDYVQSRYLTYLEQYQKMLESHVQLMEALQVYRK